MFRAPPSKCTTLQMHADTPCAQVTAMMAAPFAAVSLEGFAGKLADAAEAGQGGEGPDLLRRPAAAGVGSQQLSYARFMQLLTLKQVKRVTLMADGQIALVEVRRTALGHC